MEGTKKNEDHALLGYNVVVVGRRIRLPWNRRAQSPPKRR